jgi:hypothetical protein
MTGPAFLDEKSPNVATLPSVTLVPLLASARSAAPAPTRINVFRSSYALRSKIESTGRSNTAVVCG